MIANIPLKYAKKQLTQDREDRCIGLISEFQRPSSNEIHIDAIQSIKSRSERKANFRFAFKCATLYRKKDSNLKRSSGYDFKKALKPNPMPLNNNVSYVGFSNEEFKKIIKAETRNSEKVTAARAKDNEDLIDIEYTRNSNAGSTSAKSSINQPNQSKPYPVLQAPNIDLLNDDVIENAEDIRYSRPSGAGSFVDQSSFFCLV